jgi:hypothetical protein
MAANLVDHVLPEHVPIRQWVLTLPFALRLIALVKSEATIKKILGAMGLPTEGPWRARARPPPQEDRGTDGGDTWSN